eukprot:1219804-Amphidinium_carterae.2
MKTTSPKKSARKQIAESASADMEVEVVPDGRQAVRFQDDGSLRMDFASITQKLAKLDVLDDIANGMKELIQAQRGLSARVDTLESAVTEHTQQTKDIASRVDGIARDLTESKLQWQKSVAEMRERLIVVPRH